MVERTREAGGFSSAVPADTTVLNAFGVVDQLPTWSRPDGPESPARLGAEIADSILAGVRPEAPGREP